MFCLIKNKARFLQNSKQKIYYQIKIGKRERDVMNKYYKAHEENNL